MQFTANRASNYYGKKEKDRKAQDSEAQVDKKKVDQAQEHSTPTLKRAPEKSKSFFRHTKQKSSDPTRRIFVLTARFPEVRPREKCTALEKCF